jgi:hypothetical protein
MARPGLVRHRKFDRLAAALEPHCACGGHIAAAGALELLWSNAYEAASELIGDVDDVERAARWHGPRGLLVEALLNAGGKGQAGFLDEHGDEPGHYLIHDFWVHCPDYVKRRRERENEREARGLSLSEIRSQAGKNGAAAKHRNMQLQLLGGNCLANDKQLPDKQVANVSTPAPAPAPAPAPVIPLPAKKRRGGGERGPLPFKADEALAALSESAAGRFKITPLGGMAVRVQDCIYAYPDIGIWRLVGAWFAAGGEAYRKTLDSRHVGLDNFGAWVEYAREWDQAGRKSLDERKTLRRDTRLGVRRDR